MGRAPGPARRWLVTIVVVGLLALLVTTRKDTAASARLSHVVDTAVLPVEALVGRASVALSQDVTTARQMFHAEKRVHALEAELAQERIFVMREQAAVSEDHTLRATLGLEQSLKLPAVAATVVGESPTSWWETLVIDRGSLSGVAVGDPVLTPEGLLGRVTSVTHGDAVVMLLTNGQSGVGVKDALSGARGVALGQSGPQRLIVQFFSPTAAVKKGDRIVTSALGGGMPAGFPVGTVRQVIDTATGLIEAVVTPSADPTATGTVLVVEEAPTP